MCVARGTIQTTGAAPQPAKAGYCWLLLRSPPAEKPTSVVENCCCRCGGVADFRHRLRCARVDLGVFLTTGLLFMRLESGNGCENIHASHRFRKPLKNSNNG